MKRNIRILFGFIIMTGLLLITTDSCIKPNPVGNCWIDCICGNCGFSYADDLTEKECKKQVAEDNAADECGCGCSYTWEEY
jgi:hypothetical protein